MRKLWFAATAFAAITGWIAAEAIAQNDDRDESSSTFSYRDSDDDDDDDRDADDDENDREMERDDDAEDADDRQGDDDRNAYGPYGDNQSRTSRDYEASNDFDDDRDESDDQGDDNDRRTNPNRVWQRSNRSTPAGQAGPWRRANEDLRGDDLGDENYSSRSFDPQSRHSSTQPPEHASSHDYREGFWRRTLRQALNELENEITEEIAENRNADDDSWSQWWARWLGDDEADDNRARRLASGAREFIRQHDDDDDGYLSRGELPREMRQHFARVDRNQDEHLSRSELEQHSLRAKGHAMAQRALAQRGSSPSQARTAPVEVTYVWIAEANRGRVSLDDLQNAYDLLQRIDENNDGELTRSELRRLGRYAGASEEASSDEREDDRDSSTRSEERDAERDRDNHDDADNQRRYGDRNEDRR